MLFNVNSKIFLRKNFKSNSFELKKSYMIINDNEIKRKLYWFDYWLDGWGKRDRKKDKIIPLGSLILRQQAGYEEFERITKETFLKSMTESTGKLVEEYIESDPFLKEIFAFSK